MKFLKKILSLRICWVKEAYLLLFPVLIREWLFFWVYSPLYFSCDFNCWSGHRFCPLVVVFLVFVFPVVLLLLVRWLLCRISVGCLHWVLQLALWGGILCRLGISLCLAFGVFPAGVLFVLLARCFCFPLSSFLIERLMLLFVMSICEWLFFWFALLYICLVSSIFVRPSFWPGSALLIENCLSSRNCSRFFVVIVMI